MHRITVYRHPECARCAKIARTNHALDWLGRVGFSTETPPTGPLQMGEIVVEDARTGELLRGVAAVRKIFRQIPAYWLILPATYLPPFAAKIDRDVRGCENGSCELPAGR